MNIYLFKTDKHRKAFHIELKSIEPLKDMVIGEKLIFLCKTILCNAKLLRENATFCE